MANIYTFAPKYAEGQAMEQALFTILSSRWPQYDWRMATDREDMTRGIDFWMGNVGVQVKYDVRCAETGNFFIETIANENTGQKGGIHSSQATWVVYTDGKTGYVVKRTALLDAIRGEWLRIPRKAALNREGGKEWVSLGIPVTVKQFCNVLQPKVFCLSSDTASVP